jgi:uncharacterized membrane protein
MRQRSVLVTGIGIGAGLAYFFDSAAGARRRARARDLVAHARSRTQHALGVTSRDLRHRAYGTGAAVRALMRPAPVDNEVLVERVRARLGRVVSHPHALAVAVSDGVVTVWGPIPDTEAVRLLRAIRTMRGVRSVTDRLERHSDPTKVPALQGGRAPAQEHLDILHERWAPATRAIAGSVAATLMAVGVRRRGIRGTAALAGGAALLARAAANVPLLGLVGLKGRGPTVDVQKTVTINAPVGEVYAFWSLYENFPRFMSRVLQVTSHVEFPYRSHWKVAGPAGTAVEFDAEVTNAVPNQTIEWRTLPESLVTHTGRVRFEPLEGGRTQVQLRMSYVPPAGWIGHEIATAFGVDPRSSLNADLVRMKMLIETGRAPHDAAQPLTER